MKRWDKGTLAYRFLLAGAGIFALIVFSMFGIVGCDDDTTEVTNAAPDTPTEPVPANGSVNQDVGIGLEWVCVDPDGGNTLQYILYLGTTDDPSFVDTIDADIYNHDPLEFNTTYYWRIEAFDEYGLLTSSPVWSFTTGNLYQLDDYDTPSAYKVKVVGDLIYDLEINEGLRILTLNDTLETGTGVRIDSVGMYVSAGPNFDIDIDGDRLYIGASTGIYMIDNSDPGNPALLASISANVYNDNLFAKGIKSVNDTLYCAFYDTVGTNESSILMVLDVTSTDTLAMSVIGELEFDGIAINIALYGDYALIGDSLNGIQVFDISDPTNPTFVDTYATHGAPFSITIDGTTLYIADGDGGLTLFNITNPEAIVEISNIALPHTARDVSFYSDHAFVADYGYGGIQIVDLTAPAAPVIVDSKDTDGNACGIFAGQATIKGEDATLIYFADTFMGVFVFQYNLQ